MTDAAVNVAVYDYCHDVLLMSNGPDDCDYYYFVLPLAHIFPSLPLCCFGST